MVGEADKWRWAEGANYSVMRIVSRVTLVPNSRQRPSHTHIVRWYAPLLVFVAAVC